MQQRITIPEIKNHEWFLKNLPADLMDEKTIGNQFEEPDQPMQSHDEIMGIISEATVPAPGVYGLNSYMTDGLDMDDDMDLENDSDIDVDSSGEVVYAMWWEHVFCLLKRQLPPTSKALLGLWLCRLSQENAW